MLLLNVKNSNILGSHLWYKTLSFIVIFLNLSVCVSLFDFVSFMCTVHFKNKWFMHGFLTNQKSVILHANDKEYYHL